MQRLATSIRKRKVPYRIQLWARIFHFVIISSFACNTARYANTNKINRDIHQYPIIAWKWYYLLVQYAYNSLIFLHVKYEIRSTVAKDCIVNFVCQFKFYTK